MNQDHQFAAGHTFTSPLRFKPGMRCILKTKDSKVTVVTEGRDASGVHRRLKIREESGRELWVAPTTLTPIRETDRPTAKQLSQGLEQIHDELLRHRDRCGTCRELFERGIVLSGTCLVNRQLIWEFADTHAAWKEAAVGTTEPAEGTLW